MFTLAVFWRVEEFFIRLLGFFLFFRAFVLLLVASVVDKSLFACSVVCVTTWSSKFLGVCCLFSSKTLASVAVCGFCGILAIFIRGFSLSLLLAVGRIVFVVSLISVSRVFSMPPPTRLTTTDCLRVCLQKTCRLRPPLHMHLLYLFMLWHTVISEFDCRQCGLCSRKLSAYHHGVNSREHPLISR